MPPFLLFIIIIHFHRRSHVVYWYSHRRTL